MPEAYPLTAAGPRDAFDEQPPLTHTDRVLDTFVAPTKTFADVRRDRSWWLPFIILAVFSYLFTLTAMSHMGSRRLAESALRNNPAQSERLQQSTPEQRAQIVSFTAGIMKVSFLGWPVFVLGGVGTRSASALDRLQLHPGRHGHVLWHVRSDDVCLATLDFPVCALYGDVVPGRS